MRPADDLPWVSGFGAHEPSFGAEVFVDRAARIIGQVELGDRCSVWPGAVLRADDDRIVVGAGSAVLDQALLEAPTGRPVVVGAGVLISHQACVHGAHIEDRALVGIGAIVLDGAVVGTRSLVAAGALVPPGMVVPADTLVLGQPAKVVRVLRDDEKQRSLRQLAEVAAKAAQYLDVRASHE
ncbi:MAG: gamma carbonic anhydrase family protein [Deltaproteobacteria bacterium]|nr:gamma carbonic anhydrase family protein [Deltaproteobacteria bacterium]